MNLQAYSDYNDRAKDLNSNLSVMEDFRDNIPQDTDNNIQSENLIKIINELRDENKRLVVTTEQLQQNNGSKKDNFMEATMYIITGVIIILIMENINKCKKILN